MRWPWRREEREPPGEPPVPDDTPTRPIRVFATLDRWAVDYVAIGGIAVQAHGHPRTTRDVDILVGPEAENLERLASALRELRARLLGVDADLLGIDPTNPDHLREGANFTLMTVAGEVDVWTDAAELRGAASWPAMRARSIEAQASGIRIRVCGRDDLIRMKQAADRPKDRLDIVALTERAAARESGETRSAPSSAPDSSPGSGPSAPPPSGATASPPAASQSQLRPVVDLGATDATRTRRPQEQPLRPGPRSGPRQGL